MRDAAQSVLAALTVINGGTGAVDPTRLLLTGTHAGSVLEARRLFFWLLDEQGVDAEAARVLWSEARSSATGRIIEYSHAARRVAVSEVCRKRKARDAYRRRTDDLLNRYRAQLSTITTAPPSEAGFLMEQP